MLLSIFILDAIMTVNHFNDKKEFAES